MNGSRCMIDVGLFDVYFLVIHVLDNSLLSSMVVNGIEKYNNVSEKKTC